MILLFLQNICNVNLLFSLLLTAELCQCDLSFALYSLSCDENVIHVIIIIIIQEIFIAHNLKLKARAQCAYRQMQNKYKHLKKKKKKKERTNYVKFVFKLKMYL